jgi:hypothetical protein
MTWLESRAAAYVATGKLGRQNIKRAIRRRLEAGGAGDIEIEETFEEFFRLVNALRSHETPDAL